MTALLVCNVVLTAFLSVIWGSSNWLNILIKLSIISLLVFNGVVLLQELGYVVKL